VRSLFPVAILAGGLATRLRPITERIPKSLIEIAGKPFICHQLDYLQNQGVDRVTLCIGYLGEMIKDVVGDGAKWKIDISYSLDGPVLLGTGGAIRRAAPLLGDEFFIMYGDSYLPIDFRDVQNTFIGAGKPSLMTVLRNRNQWDKSNVIYGHGCIIEYNKHNNTSDMDYIDYGLGVINAKVLSDIELGISFDLAEMYHFLSIREQLSAYEVHERFYEIGSRVGIAETESYLLGINVK